VTGSGVTRYDISQISNARTQKGQRELWVEWKGYDQWHHCWEHRDVLMVDVPALVADFGTHPSTFMARALASKRATTVYKSVVPVGSSGQRVSTRIRGVS